MNRIIHSALVAQQTLSPLWTSTGMPSHSPAMLLAQTEKLTTLDYRDTVTIRRREPQAAAESSISAISSAVGEGASGVSAVGNVASVDNSVVSAVGSGLSNAVTNIGSEISSMDMSAGVSSAISTIPAAIPADTSELAPIVAPVSTAVTPVVSEVATSVAPIVSDVSKTGASVVSDISTVFGPVVKVTTTSVAPVVTSIESFLSPSVIGNPAPITTSTPSDQLDGVTSVLGGVTSQVGGVTSQAGAGGSEVSSAVGAVTSVLGPVTSALGPVTSALAPVTSALVPADPIVTSLLDAGRSAVGSVVSGLGSGLSSVVPIITSEIGAGASEVGSIFSDATSGISGLGSGLGGLGSEVGSEINSILSQLPSGLGGVVPGLVSDLSGVLPALSSDLGGLAPQLVSEVGSILSALPAGVSDVAPGLESLISNIVSLAPGVGDGRSALESIIGGGLVSGGGILTTGTDGALASITGVATPKNALLPGLTPTSGPIQTPGPSNGVFNALISGKGTQVDQGLSLATGTGPTATGTDSATGLYQPSDLASVGSITAGVLPAGNGNFTIRSRIPSSVLSFISDSISTIAGTEVLSGSITTTFISSVLIPISSIVPAASSTSPSINDPLDAPGTQLQGAPFRAKTILAPLMPVIALLIFGPLLVYWLCLRRRLKVKRSRADREKDEPMGDGSGGSNNGLMVVEIERSTEPSSGGGTLYGGVDSGSNYDEESVRDAALMYDADSMFDVDSVYAASVPEMRLVPRDEEAEKRRNVKFMRSNLKGFLKGGKHRYLQLIDGPDDDETAAEEKKKWFKRRKS